jgi:dTMP kinase
MAKNLVAFVGIDGSGKSSLVDALFDSRPEDYFVLRQPHKLGIKELINETDCPLAHAYLYAADRAIQLGKFSQYPTDGKTVLFDRWHDCTIAYQGYGMGVNIETLERLRTHLPPLKYVFWLDCEINTAIRRATNADMDRYGSLSAEVLNRVRQGYHAIYMNNRHSQTKYIRLDSERFSLQELLVQVKQYLE